MSDPPQGESSPPAPTPLPPAPSSTGPRLAPSIGAGGFPRSVVSQVTGIAAWGLLIGLATVIVPLVFHRVLYVLPIAGLLAGIQAIRRGQVVGGIIAVALNVLGGIFTLVGVLG